MRQEIIDLLPIAGMLIGLLAGLGIDPAAEEVSWWPGIVGLAIGSAAAFVLRRRHNAR